MPVNIGKRDKGPGWGCNCRAFRFGEPTPEQALAALARSVGVTVEDKGAYRDMSHHFEAWTDPESRYEVTWEPYGPGGWCKHAVACSVHWTPWQRQMALGAALALERIEELEKRGRKLERENERLKRKLGK